MRRLTKKTRNGIIWTAVLTAYLLVAVSLTRTAAANDTFRALKINVNDSLGTGFVTAADIDASLGDLSTRIAKTKRGELTTFHIENRLRASDKIENANVVMLANGDLLVNVEPMKPVARVFQADGSSYYINRTGKRIGAEARYHADVPVVSGYIRTPDDVTALLPLFDFIKRHPQYDALVTQIEVARNGDLIMVPAVAGHVVNLGDTSAMADKFARLHTFYADVASVRGWEYYDTLSVKWRGRVVATRADKTLKVDLPLAMMEDVVDEVPDEATQTTPVVLPDPIGR